MVANEKIVGTIAANAITDIYYILRKHTKDTLIAKKALEDLVSLFTILDVTSEDCISALALPMKDNEDAVIASVADRCGVAYIVTRNIKDFKHSPVEAIEPKDFESMSH